MKLALIAALLLVPLSQAASLTGVVVDMNGAYFANIAAELASGTNKYLARTDNAGVYQFSSLPEGKYELTFQVTGFQRFTLKSIELSEREQKQIPEITLRVGRSHCGEPYRDFVRLLPPGLLFGRLSGRVLPAAKGVEITLVCRTFTACRSTVTDSNGQFSFDTLSAGVYGLSYHREGFYPVDATEYAYTVDVGWESVYSPTVLERCPNGNCDPKRRPKGPINYCE